MKTTTIAFLAALAGFAVTSARAESRFFVGINNVPTARFAEPAYCPPPAPAFVAPTYGPFFRPTIAPRFEAPRGYWNEVPVRTWVPARWTMGRDRWGRPVRVFEAAHYAATTNRVWIDGYRG